MGEHVHMNFFNEFWRGDLGKVSKSGWFDMEWPNILFYIYLNQFGFDIFNIKPSKLNILNFQQILLVTGHMAALPGYAPQ